MTLEWKQKHRPLFPVKLEENNRVQICKYEDPAALPDYMMSIALVIIVTKLLSINVGVKLFY